MAAVALAGMLVGSAAAYADATSPSPIDEQTAGRIRDGVVKIDDRVTREAKGRSHGSQSPASHAIELPVIDASAAKMMTEFCSDSATNAAASGDGAQAIALLCPGLAAAPLGRVAVVPGRGEVLGAFRELGLYRGAVQSDPGRVSFVNLETYFWCGDGEATCATLGERERTVTLLGQAVRIRPRILGYQWRFGDGSGESVTGGRVAHTYRRTGSMPVSVTLTWTADYAVGTGGFRAIGGTTTTTSPVRVLPVQETQSVASG